MRRHTPAAALPAVLLLSLLACEAEKSSNPLSPSVAGPIPGVQITPPKLLEPAQGFKYKESQQPIKLLIENASSTGVRTVRYMFEVATDTDFTTKVYARSGVPAGEGGRTSVQIDRLDLGRAYYWRAKADDGANSSLFSSAQFEVLPKPFLGAPGLVAPVNGDRAASRRPTLTVNNADRNAAVGGVDYEFQIGDGPEFRGACGRGSRGRNAGAVEVRVPASTSPTIGCTTGARARTDRETTGAWAGSPDVPHPAWPSPRRRRHRHRAPRPVDRAIRATPRPSSSASARNTGTCRTIKWRAFMRAVAHSLNANGIGGGPFGILRKSGGTNCGGYSCDVLCSGSGGAQRQYDMLGDIDGAQNPGWSGPNTLPGIRVDVCEVQ